MDVGWSGHCLKLPSYNSLGMAEGDGEERREFWGIVTGRGLGKTLKRIYKRQRKRGWVWMNLSRINPGLMKNV